MKIIFLDIDGVLNCQNAYLRGECKYVGDKAFHYQQFGLQQKQWLNKLIEETQAKIVISSSWRTSGIKFMKKVWEQEQMSGEIIGITPYLWIQSKDSESHESISRGEEIKKWLRDNNFYHINWEKSLQREQMTKSGIENYIIIDDDSDMLYTQRNHFVHVLPSPCNMEGFNEQYYNEALEKLSKTVIELNYDSIK